MNESFSDRQKGFEAKFKRDQETEFKVDARRNKLLGPWFAQRLGLPPQSQDDYKKARILAAYKK